MATTAKQDWTTTAAGIEESWAAALGSAPPYEFFTDLRMTDRQHQLFAAACCHHPLIWALLDDPRSRKAVEVAEKFIDRRCEEAALHAAWSAANAVARAAWAANRASWAAAGAADANARSPARKEMWAWQGRLLVSFVGPGWEFSPDWRTDTAAALARTMYDSREFSAMPILADALQDAGCNETELLDALRSPDSVWARGCRILDELLELR